MTNQSFSNEMTPYKPTWYPEEPQGEHCPYCPDQGFWVRPNRNTGEPEQVQCEWCYTTPNSVFNQRQ